MSETYLKSDHFNGGGSSISGTISDIPVTFSEGLERLSTSPVHERVAQVYHDNRDVAGSPSLRGALLAWS
jgi:hypothetical protein